MRRGKGRYWMYIQTHPNAAFSLPHHIYTREKNPLLYLLACYRHVQEMSDFFSYIRTKRRWWRFIRLKLLAMDFHFPPKKMIVIFVLKEEKGELNSVQCMMMIRTGTHTHFRPSAWSSSNAKGHKIREKRKEPRYEASNIILHPHSVYVPLYSPYPIFPPKLVRRPRGKTHH